MSHYVPPDGGAVTFDRAGQCYVLGAMMEACVDGKDYTRVLLDELGFGGTTEDLLTRMEQLQTGIAQANRLLAADLNAATEFLSNTTDFLSSINIDATALVLVRVAM